MRPPLLGFDPQDEITSLAQFLPVLVKQERPYRDPAGRDAPATRDALCVGLLVDLGESLNQTAVVGDYPFLETLVALLDLAIVPLDV